MGSNPMDPELRELVVKLLSRRPFSNEFDIYECFQSAIGKDETRQHSQEIIRLWRNFQRSGVDSPPPTPHTSVASVASLGDGQRRQSIQRQLNLNIGDDPCYIAIVKPDDGSWFRVRSKQHTDRGSYIKNSTLNPHGTDCMYNPTAEIQWQPRGWSPSQPLGRTIFNVISSDEAQRIGMGDLDAVFGIDCESPLDQQYQKGRDQTLSSNSAVQPTGSFRALSPASTSTTSVQMDHSETRPEPPEPSTLTMSYQDQYKTFNISWSGVRVGHGMAPGESDILSFTKSITEKVVLSPGASQPSRDNLLPSSMMRTIGNSTSPHMSNQTQISGTSMESLDQPGRVSTKRKGEDAGPSETRRRRMDITSICD